MKHKKTHNPELWSELRKNKKMRIELATQSFYWFFHIYFGDHARLPTATFQKEIYSLLEDEEIKHLVIVAFRGSGKSTIATLAFPIWSVLGKLNRKFVLLLSQTQPLAKVHLQNIKRSFESNELLRNDFGPLNETSDEWGSMSLVLAKYNARISAASTDQSIRGIKYGPHRPDIIIADDVEDMSSVQTQESRNRTYNWFVSEVIPAGDQNTKIVNIGNLLHEDSLLMRLKEKIDSKIFNGTYREYPIADINGKPLWPGKYPNSKALTEQKQKVVDEISWFREYCLKIVADHGQLIKPEWIQFYDELPPQDEAHEFLGTFIGVDLAISEKQTADCTALVIIHAYGYKTKDRKYYFSHHFLNERLSFMASKVRIEEFALSMKSKEKLLILVEDNSYQHAMVEVLQDARLNVKGLRSISNKHARLATASMLFEQGKVFFPSDNSCKPIIMQLLGFGIEKHDDLCDASTLALNYISLRVKWVVLMGILGGRNEEPICALRYED